MIAAAFALILTCQTPVPDLSGQWSAGTITQQGRNFTVEGAVWKGAGTIRPDGFVQIAWTSGGRLAMGIYAFDGPDLDGHWGWADAVEITPEGDICGEIVTERLVRSSR